MGWIFYFIFFLLVVGCYFCYFRYPIARAPAGNGLRATGGVTVSCYFLLLSVTLGLVFWCRARWGEGQTGKETHEEGTEKLVCLFLSVPCRPHPQEPQRRPLFVRRKHISLGLFTPCCPRGGRGEGMPIRLCSPSFVSARACVLSSFLAHGHIFR